MADRDASALPGRSGGGESSGGRFGAAALLSERRARAPLPPVMKTVEVIRTTHPTTLASVPPDRIIGQQRVIALVTFIATPFVLLAIPGDVFVSFLAFAALGIFLLFLARFRSVGVGLVFGTMATFGVLLLLGSMYAGLD